MSLNVLTIEKAKHYSSFPEITKLFSDLIVIEDIELDALKYLIDNKIPIFLPNVKSLNNEKLFYLKKFKNKIRLGLNIT